MEDGVEPSEWGAWSRQGDQGHHSALELQQPIRASTGAPGEPRLQAHTQDIPEAKCSQISGMVTLPHDIHKLSLFIVYYYYNKQKPVHAWIIHENIYQSLC